MNDVGDRDVDRVLRPGTAGEIANQAIEAITGQPTASTMRYRAKTTMLPGELSRCVPLTTAFRQSPYETEFPVAAFLTQKGYANVQGLQAIQHREFSFYDPDGNGLTFYRNL